MEMYGSLNKLNDKVREKVRPISKKVQVKFQEQDNGTKNLFKCKFKKSLSHRKVEKYRLRKDKIRKGT